MKKSILKVVVLFLLFQPHMEANSQSITEVPSWIHSYLLDSAGTEYYSTGAVLKLAIGPGIKNRYTLHADSDWTITDDDHSVDIEPKSGSAGDTPIIISGVTSGDLGKGIEITQPGVGGSTIITDQEASKQSVVAHDSTIYVGDSWVPKDNFDSATSSLGQSIEFSGNLCSGSVDTATPGDYQITYTNGEDVEKTVTVTVLDRPVLPKDVIVQYVDENNNKIHEDQRISGNIGDPYDASKNIYKIEIEGYNLDETKLPNNMTGTISDSEQKVTYVYQGVLALSVPEIINFGSYKLGTSGNTLSYPGGAITVLNYTGGNWSLNASLEDENSDFANYLMNGSEKLTQNPTVAKSISSSEKSTIITSSWMGKIGLWVDYSSADSIRNDSETLDWTLSPDIQKGVRE